MRGYEHLWNHVVESAYLDARAAGDAERAACLDAVLSRAGFSESIRFLFMSAVRRKLADAGCDSIDEDIECAVEDGLLADPMRDCISVVADVAVSEHADSPELVKALGLDPRIAVAVDGPAAKAADCISVSAVKRWFAERDEAIMAKAVDWPACWGGQFRVSDFGLYVSEDVFNDALPSDHDRNLYYCCCDCFTDDEWLEVARHRTADAWLDQVAESYVASDSAVVFYTESFPGDDFTHDELVEMAQERRDLFTRENLDDWPDLIKPALDAGIDCAIDGEPTWFCPEEGFKGLHSLPELRSYFENEPQLAQDREAGSTCETWIVDQERMGNLVPLFGFERGTPVDDLMDGLSKPIVAGVPFYDETCGSWRQAVVDQDGNEYAPLCDNLRKATWSDSPSERADRAAAVACKSERGIHEPSEVIRHGSSR